MSKLNETLLGRADAGLGDGLFDSVAWVIDVIGMEKTPLHDQWQSAVLYSVNEDYPVKVEFYSQSIPNVNDTPHHTWLRFHTCQACDHKGWLLADAAIASKGEK